MAPPHHPDTAPPETTGPVLLPVDRRPVIPGEEYAGRLALVQALAETLRLDAVVVYGDDRAVMGAGNVRWLTDYYPHFEPIAVIVAPGRDPIAVTGPESGSYIETSSRFAGEIAVTQEFVHPDEEYPFTTVQRLESVLLRLLGRDAGAGLRLGLVGADIVTPLLDAALRRLGEVVPVDRPFVRLRARKTPAELAVIRYAYSLAEHGIRAALGALSIDGVTEREVGAEIDHALRRGGAEGTGIDTIVAAGRDHTYPILHRTSNRRILPGDSVILTVAPRYEGYHGAIGRTVLVGDVDPRVRRARDVAIDAQRRTAARLRSGAAASDIDQTARGVVGAAGYADHFLYSAVHSIGVTEFEPPILSGFDDTVVQPGMVFSIDIPMFHAPWGGLRAEDGYEIGEDGAVPLQTLPSALDLG